MRREDLDLRARHKTEYETVENVVGAVGIGRVSGRRKPRASARGCVFEGRLRRPIPNLERFLPGRLGEASSADVLELREFL